MSSNGEQAEEAHDTSQKSLSGPVEIASNKYAMVYSMKTITLCFIQAGALVVCK